MSSEPEQQADQADEEMVGTELERREDASLISGDAKYTDDLKRAECLHLSIVRSPYGHARIVDIDTSGAEAADGVHAVYTGTDLAESETPNDLKAPGMYLPSEDWPFSTEPGEQYLPEFPYLAEDKVLFQGHPVALVVGEDRYVASEGADLVNVEYDRLEAVTDPAEAVDEPTDPIYEDNPSNTSFDWEIGDEDEVDDAFDEADHTVSLDIEHPRVIPDAIEPRGTIAEVEPATDNLTLHMTTQNPHHHRLLLSKTLDYPEHKIRIVAPEVGGGFGVKIHHYPEEALTAWCALQLEQPIKWIQRRSEAHMADAHARGHVTEASMALDDEGHILGLEADTHAALGAYVSSHASLIPTGSYALMLPGPYNVPAIRVRVVGAFTNTAPVDAYRGAGQPESAFVIHRLLMKAAHELDLDPAEVMRRNYIPPDDFPHETVTHMLYDSGEYEKALDRALEMVDYDEWRERQETAREDDRYIGVGLTSFVELTGLSPSNPGVPGPFPTFGESSQIRFLPSGKVTAFSGTASQGQGHETVFAQILSDELGVDYDDIEIIQGDTDEVPQGTGAFASRSAVVGGNAMARSAEKIREKATKIAAHEFEAAEEDIEFEDGEFHVAGVPDRALTIQEIADMAHKAGPRIPDDMEPGLDAHTFFDPSGLTVPFGTHAVVVEVDPDSGEFDILEYVAVDDCGVQLNPKIVEGQIHGGIAQGLGPAMQEEAVYDDNGNLVTGLLQDYALPKSVHLPDFQIDSTETPSPTNDLGVKGVGEAGTIAATVALVNAVVDAVQPLGVDHLNLPVKSEKVWRAIEAADGGDE